MRILGIDVGSSSVKAAILRDGKFVSQPVRVPYPTRHEGTHVEVDPPQLLDAVHRAANEAGKGEKPDAIALSVMSPAWVAMDADGKPITPIVTHQDRRSVDQARHIESTVGKDRHLALAGNRPVPGGITSTTFAWFKPQLKDASLVGHLNTFLIRQWTGQRVIDPGNASFTGLYRTVDLGGWSDELCDAVGIDHRLLPEIRDGDQIAGTLTTNALGLPQGTPVLTGLVDTSSAMLATGAAIGQLFHMCGSTDVLGLCTDQPRPNERLITRALGIGRKWMAVSTIAAAGSSIDWIRREFFRDLSDVDFHRLAAQPRQTTVQFAPYLAGDRMTIDQPTASFNGLTLATQREDLLAAVVHALSDASLARLSLLPSNVLPTVFVSGGGAGAAEMMHRGWPAAWTYKPIEEASLLGLGTLTARPNSA